ncbi:MAG: hypothetical protein L0H53_14710 [Candidatus Nitrosocosmicus sp.]|nr:hypothetical protein [Candidatus Nitrosocosmicus sp.]
MQFSGFVSNDQGVGGALVQLMKLEFPTQNEILNFKYSSINLYFELLLQVDLKLIYGLFNGI